jgi:hypothetical protein
LQTWQDSPEIVLSLPHILRVLPTMGQKLVLSSDFETIDKLKIKKFDFLSYHSKQLGYVLVQIRTLDAPTAPNLFRL